MPKFWMFIVLGILLYVEAQGQGILEIPDWCPPGSPRIRCFANPCTVERCPAFRRAICINDNPCERACSGSFYIEGRGRLSRRECYHEGGGPPGIPDFCPAGSPRIRCLVNPCSFKHCQGVRQAQCLADNPCEPACSGDFYVVEGGGQHGRRHGRKLSEFECAARPPGGY